jgi:hypothetical protein
MIGARLWGIVKRGPLLMKGLAMTKVIVDQATLSKLHHLAEPLEFCNESGRTLGYFSPAVDRSLYDKVKVPFTDEELDRFEQELGGRSLAEILADLEKRQ